MFSFNFRVVSLSKHIAIEMLIGMLLKGNKIFRDLVRSHLVRSLPPIGPFATRYFSHLFAPYRP